jgi:hypothetical protein
MTGRFTHELHAHLHGCLRAAEVHALGAAGDLWKRREARLEWYAAEFARARGVTPKWRDYWTRPDGLERLAADFEVRTSMSFPAFQASFNLMIALFPVDPDDGAFARAVLRSQRNAGVRYGEYRCFVPPPAVLPTEALPRYFRTLAAAAVEVERESGGAFVPRLVLTLSRSEETFAPQYAALRGVLDSGAAADGAAKHLVGIDFCGAEAGFPPRTAAGTMAAIARDNRRDPARALAVLYHVGEVWDHAGPFNAVRWIHQAHVLGAHRLGHATALGADGPGRWEAEDNGAETATAAAVVESTAERMDHLAWLEREHVWLERRGYPVHLADVRRERERLAGAPGADEIATPWSDAVAADLQRLQDAVTEELAARGAVVESCPTSNLRLSALEEPLSHPLLSFLEAGLETVVGADDPGVFVTSLADEEGLLRELFGFNDAAIERLATSAESAHATRLARRGEATT